MQIIPAINATDFEKVKRMILQAAEFVIPAGGWIHVDVADGKFTESKTWGDPKNLETSGFNFGNLHPIHFEIHLMVQNPEGVIESWLRAGAERAIVHVEAMQDAEVVQEKCREYGAQAMLSSNPETKPETILPHIGKFDYFQVLAVKPGPAGQEFNPMVINKIKFVRERAPNAKIEVDGGMNLRTGKLVKSAGADILVSASYLWESKNPRKAFDQLLNL